MPVVAEGVDYSATANANWDALAQALAGNGKKFAGRYAVYDKSPNGRGITGAEYQALKRHGVETFLYYEESEAWMLGGWEAGVRAASRAIDVVRSEGLPAGMPVYYSHDVDPTPDQFAAIDECLKGAASIVGFNRVGFYGGWAGIDHVANAKTAKWFCQTIAWQYGRGLHPAIHLHQYGFNTYFAGTNCDLVAALQPHYGQAGDFDGTTTTTTTPPPIVLPPKPIPAPDKMSAQGYPLSHNDRRRWTCVQGGRFKTAPSRDAPDVKDRAGKVRTYNAGKNYTFDYHTDVRGERWLVAGPSGVWAVAKNFTQESR